MRRVEFPRRGARPTVRKGAARNGFKLREVAAVAYDEIASQDDVRVPSGVTDSIACSVEVLFPVRLH